MRYQRSFTTCLKRSLFKYHGYCTFGVFLLILALSITSEICGWETRWQLVVTILSLVVSSSFLIQRQKLQETELFNDLFQEFNSRYDEMNECLLEIKNSDGEDESDQLKDEKESKLVDYFNLCAEEYLFYKRGYVPPEVWRAWREGMRFYMEDQHIRDLWKQEKETDSYYGLEMPMPQDVRKHK